MPPKRKLFRPLVLSKCLALTGGYSTKKFVPETCAFPCYRGGGEKAGDPSEEMECVQINHKAAWLCEMSTGVCLFQRPLARVRIIRQLHSHLMKHLAAMIRHSDKDIQMEALAFDSDASEDF